MMGRLAELAECVNGSLLNGDAEFAGVSIDTRTLKPGDAFVALTGANHDGHDFIRRAAGLGAVGALVDRSIDTRLPCITVPDTLDALQCYAAHWRQTFAIPLIGITGSNGKTTIKEMLRSILSAAYGAEAVHATRGNLNNHIGVPLTLLELRDKHRAAVIEMGANHAGEIALLASLTQPTVGLVSNAGAAHLEGFGSIKGVAKAKGELFAGLADDAVAVINIDDPHAALWVSLSGVRRRVTFGFSAAADVRVHDDPNADDADSGDHVRNPFALDIDGQRLPVSIPLPGRHNRLNAAAAAAAAVAAGISVASIVEGLAAMRPVGGRLRILDGRNGCRIIDDSYNANPSSVAAAIQVLAEFSGRRYLVLGDMAELGGDVDDMLHDLGVAAREAGIDVLLTVGDRVRVVADGFGSGARHFSAKEQLVAALADDVAEAHVLLVKGSRTSGMESIVNALTDSAAEG